MLELYQCSRSPEAFLPFCFLANQRWSTVFNIELFISIFKTLEKFDDTKWCKQEP